MGEETLQVFRSIAEGQQRGVLIRRSSDKDKEFHFQNWVEDRIASAGVEYTASSRNGFPDFLLGNGEEGVEVKGLQTPGRENTFDANSRMPLGEHKGRTVYYAFGRYPKGDTADKDFKLQDLVYCHGDFLGVDYGYAHKNKHVLHFGAYGDIMIRDRKMYVPRTPFSLLNGASGAVTLILPEGENAAVEGLREVGSLVRVEVLERVIAYRFDLRTNDLTVEKELNPSAGTQHRFTAWRLPDRSGETGQPVSLRTAPLAEEDVVEDVDLEG